MYVDFSQDRQGRLVHVRTVVAATCIQILSQVAQCNEDLIACSHVSSNHLKRKSAYTGRDRLAPVSNVNVFSKIDNLSKIAIYKFYFEVEILDTKFDYQRG